MSHSNAQAFKTLNLTVSTNPTDAIKQCKGKSKSGTYCGSSHKFGQCLPKVKMCNIYQKIGHCAKVCGRNTKRKTK